MEKSAEFIRKKEFHIVFKGYKPEEVDKFLDILSVEFDRLLKKNRELQDSLDKLKFEDTEDNTDIKKVIQDALISAHKVAEDIKSQAKKEADAIIEQRNSEEDRSMHDLQMKKLQMEESLIVLQGKYDDFKNKIKKTVFDMTEFIDETNAEFDAIGYTGTGFADAKFTTGEGQDLSMGNGGVQKTAEGEVLPVKGKGSGDQIKEESQADDPNKIERTSTETGKNVFNNYNLSNESESGYYFERIQEQPKEPEKESLKKPNTGYESSDTQKEEPQKINESDSNLKRERKKIDIANPDIIENFFRTSDD
jgi:cell division initiation protein